MKKFAASALGLLLSAAAFAQSATQGGGRDHLPTPSSDFPLLPLAIGVLVGLVIGYFLGARSKKA